MIPIVTGHALRGARAAGTPLAICSSSGRARPCACGLRLRGGAPWCRALKAPMFAGTGVLLLGAISLLAVPPLRIGPRAVAAGGQPARPARALDTMNRQRKLGDAAFALYVRTQHPDARFHLSPRKLAVLQGEARVAARGHFRRAMVLLRKLRTARIPVPPADKATLLADYAWYLRAPVSRPVNPRRIGGKWVLPSQIQIPMGKVRSLVRKAVALSLNDPMLWVKAADLGATQFYADYSKDKVAARRGLEAWGADSAKAVALAPTNPNANLCRVNYLLVAGDSEARQCKRWFLFLKNRKRTDMEEMEYSRTAFDGFVSIAWATLRKRDPEVLKRLPHAEYERLRAEHMHDHVHVGG